jgi:hypothetical protein
LHLDENETVHYHKGMESDPTFLAYVAGIMDGEGCFRIERIRPHGAHKTPQYRVLVGVQMGDEAVIDAITSRLGITARYVNLQQWSYKKNQPRRPAYRIQLQSKKAADFIRLILPYLIGKKEQAILCLEFYDLISSQQRIKREFGEEELALRADYHDRVAALKRPVLALGSGLSTRDVP